MPHRARRRVSAKPLLDASRSGYWRRRVELAPPARARLMRRRQRIATCLACIAGACLFFALYVLSWTLVLGG